MNFKRIVLIILPILVLLIAIGSSVFKITKRSPINVINLGFEINLPEPDSYIFNKSNRGIHGDGELVIIVKYNENLDLQEFNLSTAEQVSEVIKNDIYFDEILNIIDIFSSECEHYSYQYDNKSLYISFNRQDNTYLIIALYF